MAEVLERGERLKEGEPLATGPTPPLSDSPDLRSREISRNLYWSVLKGNNKYIEEAVERDPGLLKQAITRKGETLLHLAILMGKAEIAEWLLKQLSQEDEQILDSALSLATLDGCMIEVVKLLADKCPRLSGGTVVDACIGGGKDIPYFLYGKTHKNDRQHYVHNLILACISNQHYDIALDVIEQFPQSLQAALLDEDVPILEILSTRRPSFVRGSPLAFWQDWIYKCLSPKASRSSSKLCEPRGDLCWNFTAFCVPSLKNIYEAKMEHIYARKLVCSICEYIFTVPSMLYFDILSKALFKAVSYGNVEFLEDVAKHLPYALFSVANDKSQTLYVHAILEHQHEICSFLGKIGAANWPYTIRSRDDEYNSILHLAAKSSSSRTGTSSSPAFQFQNEINWFKEVEKMLSVYKDIQNLYGQTPRDIFREEHAKLKRDTEEWMKSTAESCMVVATLIVTIMFAAAFTVPGGYNGDTGDPLYLHSSLFIVYIMSDVSSLFLSSISVLEFLAIHTSLYKEEDFLRRSVSNKLLIGLSTLFLSIVAMMIAFSIAIVIMIRHRSIWISMPIIIIASIPLTIFIMSQFPLLMDTFHVTYGSIFFRHSKK